LAALALAALAAASTLPLPPAFTATAAAKSTGVIGAPDAHGCIRRKARLPFDHHAIAVANAAGDDGETARRSLDDDGTLPGRVRTIHHIDV